MVVVKLTSVPIYKTHGTRKKRGSYKQCPYRDACRKSRCGVELVGVGRQVEGERLRADGGDIRRL